MLVNRKIINYGALASILCLVVFATDATKAQNASPPQPTTVEQVSTWLGLLRRKPIPRPV